MAKIKLPSGRTVTVNFGRVLVQLREVGIDPEGDPPNDLKLRVFIDALAWIGLDLDSTFDDFEAMLSALRDHTDRREDKDDDRFNLHDDDDPA